MELHASGRNGVEPPWKLVGGSAGFAGARCTDRGLCGKMSAVMPSAHVRSIRKLTPVLNYGLSPDDEFFSGHGTYQVSLTWL